MDITSIGGIVFAIACILGGQAIEGGHAGALVQATAAIIVIGGTIGACAVAFPMPDFLKGAKMGALAFKNKKSDSEALIKQIVELAAVARREGVLALEQKLSDIKEPILKRAVGILGAVLGLIHVMENLSDPSKLGGGIATAFVATVYGVGAANLLFLPIANKLKRKLGLEKERKTLIAEGVLSIQAGLNPRVLEEKLASYSGHHAPKEGGKDHK